jgi:hypothetical protein
MSNKSSLPSAVRNCVWNTYIGIELKQGLCFCCKIEPITFGNFECGHIVARSNGGNDTIQNLRPVCGLCNKSMGTMNMESFMEKYGFATETKKLCSRRSVQSESLKRKVPNKNSEKVKQVTIQSENESDFFENLLIEQLQQICMVFSIYHGGTKDKLIQKIIKKNITIDDIEREIDTGKKYFIVCDGYEIPEECRKDKKNENNGWHLCDRCDRIKNLKTHVYFSDNKVFEGINTMRGYYYNTATCKQCNKICYMQEYENYFWRFTFPKSNINVENSNTNNKLYAYLDSLKLDELQQLCKSIKDVDENHWISLNGSKDKIINKLVENGSMIESISKFIESIRDKKFTCNRCRRDFSKKSHLTDHLNKKIPCDKLPDIISEEINILSNIQVTNDSIIKNLNDFKCAYCGKEFTRKANVLYHLEHSCKIVKEANNKKNDIFSKLLQSREELQKSKTEMGNLKEELELLKKKLNEGKIIT